MSEDRTEDLGETTERLKKTFQYMRMEGFTLDDFPDHDQEAMMELGVELEKLLAEIRAMKESE